MELPQFALLCLFFSAAASAAWIDKNPAPQPQPATSSDCTDEWVWGDCVAWRWDADGCGIEGRQQAYRENPACTVIAFTVKCKPVCDHRGGGGGRHGQTLPEKPQDEEDQVKRCEYEVTSDWSSCDKLGRRFRSKKLTRGPVECLPKVDEYQPCDQLVQDTSFIQDEPPKEEECVYRSFGPWSSCENGQKRRSKELKSGGPSCSGKVLEVKHCKDKSQRGCRYERSQKHCDKCDEQRGTRDCFAPVEASAPDRCEPYLRITKKC